MSGHRIEVRPLPVPNRWTWYCKCTCGLYERHTSWRGAQDTAAGHAHPFRLGTRAKAGAP